MHEIELVVFDMAGTTVNDEGSVNRCIREALGAVGLELPPAAVDRVMGLPKPQALSILVEESGRLLDLGPRLDAIHRDFVARSTAYYCNDPAVREVRGASEVFRSLRRAGIGVALNTGFDRAITDVILDRLGWTGEGLIDATIASDEVARGRPHPDMIRELMRRRGVAEAARVAKVGDTPFDLEEGTSAGCGLVIGVTNGSHSREELATWPHTHLVASVREVPALLGLDVDARAK